MNWETFYLVCFLAGFLASAVSFLAGALHLPHFHGAHGHAAGGNGIPVLNFGTIAAFLAWFGGTGFLLERYSAIWVFLGLFISVISGLIGAAVVFWFLAKLSFLLFVFIWIRATLPRFRYDQLMSFAWKFLFPVALLNLLITAFMVAVWP